VLLKFIEKDLIKKYNPVPGIRLRNYLMTLCVNKGGDEFRRERSRNQKNLSTDDTVTESGSTRIDFIEASQPGPQQQAELNELIAIVSNQYEDLSTNQKTAFLEGIVFNT